MKTRRLEVADVVRSCESDFVSRCPVSPEQRKALRDIVSCRTAALGGHVWRCDHCDHELIDYNSCRNRHCPKCQGARQAQWLEARAAEVLPAPYFHAVFTLPRQLGPLVLQNQRVLYGLLFAAVSQTLQTIAGDERHLGARIGFLALLHTWDQKLLHHPHVHCLIPGGGLSADQSRWIASRPAFFLPVRVLSRRFRRRFLDLLLKAHRSGLLGFAGHLQPPPDPTALRALTAALRQSEWVVYCKPPFDSPQRVLKYLARYTYRTAISNRRLLSLQNREVTFRYRDRPSRQTRTLTLSAQEFVRRFLLHVLPRGFVRIRSFGFLCNRLRKQKLVLCRRLIGESQTPAPPPLSCPVAPAPDSHTRPCPACRRGLMLRVEALPPSLCNPQPRSRSP